MVLVAYLIATVLCHRQISKLDKSGYFVSEFKPKKIGKYTLYLGSFSPTKWFSFLLGVFLGFIWKYIEHIFHQLIIRMYDPYCRPNCIDRVDKDNPENNGKCTGCGCHAISKMLSPFEKDHKGSWGKLILSRSKYKDFRNKYPREVVVKKLY